MQDQIAKRLNLKKGDLVLDAGCGRGIVSCYLAKKYKVSIVGVDLAAHELRSAKKRSKKLDLGGQVEYIQGDYSVLNFPNSHFDSIYTVEAFVHSDNLQKTLKEFYRLLKPKGKLTLFEYSISDAKEFSLKEKIMLDLIINETSCTALAKMKHGVLEGYLKKAGFKNIKTEDITDKILPSANRLYKYAKIPYLIINALKLQKTFINTTIAVEFYKFFVKRLARYNIYTVTKN